jgi:hypothetical protein
MTPQRAEVLLDRLADVLFGADEIIGILQRGSIEALPAEWLDGVEARVVRIYDEVNGLMKQLSS